MKIAILSFYSGRNYRGVESWAESVKLHLRQGCEVTVISGREGEPIFWNAIKTAAEWLKSDIVVPTNGRLQAAICRLLTWITGKPLVVFGHAGLGADDKFNLLCSPDVFVAFSSHQSDWAERFKLPWTKVVTIPHAVDTKLFAPDTAKKPGRVVLSVATNTPPKRIFLVEKATRTLSGARFMAVGKGNPIEVEPEKMPEIYRRADVFCLVPQPWDAFGLVFLEALASNLPVVTTGDPIRREIVGDAGILVENPGDIHQLASAINKAFTIKWGDKPRRQAEKFSWDKIAKQYEELFTSLIK